MIPELGHFARHSRALGRRRAGRHAARRRSAWGCALDRLRAPRRTSAIPARGGGVCVPGGIVRCERLLGDVRRRELELEAPDPLPIRGDLGPARRVAPSLILMLAGWSAAVSLASRQLPDAMVARVLGMLGLVSTGFLRIHLLGVESLRAACDAACGRARSQSAVAGSRHGGAPRRCFTWGTSASRWLLHSRLPPSSPDAWMLVGLATA